MHCSPDLGDHHFELFSKLITYLLFIKIHLWSFTLLFGLEHNPLFLHFPLLSVLVSACWIKQPYIPVLTEWSHIDDKSYH